MYVDQVASCKESLGREDNFLGGIISVPGAQDSGDWQNAQLLYRHSLTPRIIITKETL